MARTTQTRGRLIPDGSCWCGCGADAAIGKFFVPGHDKTAESAVIELEYETVARFITEHGYGGPGRKSPVGERDKKRRAKT